MDRQTEIDRQTYIHPHGVNQRQRWKDTQVTDRQIDRGAHTQTERHTERHRDRDEQTQRQTYRQ